MFSISTSLLHGQIEDKFRQAAEAGFRRIDVNAEDVTSSSLNAKDIAKLARSLGLEIGKYQPFYDLEGLTGALRVQAFSRFEAKLEIASVLSAKIVLLGSSGHPNANGDLGAIDKDLLEAAELAAKHNLKIAYLALPWASYIQDSLDAYERVLAVNHPAFGLALSSYFSLADGSKPARYRELQGDKILSVQLADAPVSDVDISRFKHEYANLPGLGDLNLSYFIRILLENGYQGDWSLARMGRLETASANRANDAYRSLANLFDQTREISGNLDFGTDGLPERARVTGIEFLEFVVDKKSGKEMRELLSTICFRFERKHKTKNVELWRQGAINIVLNFAKEGFAFDTLQANGPGLCDMGLRVADAQQTSKRARALGIAPIEKNLGVGELDIPAINGVGRSIIHFVDEKSDLHRVWDIEFEPVSQSDVVAPAGLRRIDHLAQAMRHDEMQSWLLFYLSTFNMKKSPVVDVQDPSGVVYSQAVESPEGEIRLNLNGASSEKTYSGSFLAGHIGAGVQHIAFLSDDIFETAERLKETGFQFLEVPSNYYDDLGLNYGLEQEFVDRMRALNILYAQNQTGKYFQIYSQSIWGGFFFEIVQRQNGYVGYGAKNAPVRLAAQQAKSNRVQS